MILKEVYIPVEGRLNDRVPVVFTEQVASRTTLASLLGDRTGWTGHFYTAITVKDEEIRVFYGKTRRHKEFEQAVVQEMGNQPDELYRGQIHNNPEGIWTIILHKPLEGRIKARVCLMKLINGINPSLWGSRVTIGWGREDAVKFTYNPKTRQLRKYKRLAKK